MRLELWLLLITVFVLGNVYYEGRWLRLLSANQKYLKMAGIVFAAYTAYWLFRGNPNRQNAAQIAASALRDLDADASAQLAPLLDRLGGAVAAAPSVGASDRYQSTPWSATGLRDAPARPGTAQRLHRRSVSEATKKRVAASQNWTCGNCLSMLAASYEIDHIVRLDRGGDNSIQNLVALCRNCHGEKTSMELM